MYSKIFMMFLLFDLSCCYHLFEFSKYPVNVQPNGTINYDILLKIFQDDFLRINFFKKTYNRHTNFALEKKKKNKSPTFGETFSFSPLSYCDNDNNKNLATQCLKYRPSNWWCIYDACISPSCSKFHYVKITLPQLYKKDDINNTCVLY